MKRRGPPKRKRRLARFSRQKAARAFKPSGKGLGYAGRNGALRALGFRSYHAYLHSELWHGIRARVLGRDGGFCRTCPRPADIVHHVSYSYDTLAGKNLDGLLSLCARCHEKIEMAGARKRSFFKARALTKRMVDAFEFEPA